MGGPAPTSGGADSGAAPPLWFCSEHALKQSFFLAKKHILFRLSVKLNAFNMKLKSIIPEVIQRLCAKFGANWNIGGTIMDAIAFLPVTSTF